MKYNSKKVNYLISIIIIIAVLIIAQMRGDSNISLDFGDDSLTVRAPKEFSFSVAYDEISSIDLVEFNDPGNMLSGGENRNCSWGDWENEAWGQYTRGTSAKADTAILVTTTDNAHLVFSYEDDDTTASLIQGFNELLASRENEPTA